MQVFSTRIVSLIFILFSYCNISVLSITPAQCKGVDVAMTEDDMAKMGECIAQFAGSDQMKDIPNEKMPCFGKCIMMKRGLADDKGIPQKEAIIKLINDSMPKDVLKELDAKMSQCIDDFGSKVDPKDETCKSYGPLIGCVMKSFKEVCQTGDDEEETSKKP